MMKKYIKPALETMAVDVEQMIAVSGDGVTGPLPNGGKDDGTHPVEAKEYTGGLNIWSNEE